MAEVVAPSPPCRVRRPARPWGNPDTECDCFLEYRYPAFGNLVDRDVAWREIIAEFRAGRGVGARGNSVYLDFRDAPARVGRATIAHRYGNLFDMYAYAHSSSRK